jgi:hypothetical protein
MKYRVVWNEILSLLLWHERAWWKNDPCKIIAITKILFNGWCKAWNDKKLSVQRSTQEHYRASTIVSVRYWPIIFHWDGKGSMYKLTLTGYSAGHQPIYNLEKANEPHRLNHGVIQYWGFRAVWRWEGTDEPVWMRGVGEARKSTVWCGRSVGQASPAAIAATADEVRKSIDRSGRLARWPTRRSRVSSPTSALAPVDQLVEENAALWSSPTHSRWPRPRPRIWSAL